MEEVLRVATKATQQYSVKGLINVRVVTGSCIHFCARVKSQILAVNILKIQSVDKERHFNLNNNVHHYIVGSALYIMYHFIYGF